MVVGDVFDQTLEQYRVVAGLDRVGNAILAALPSTSTQPVADRPGSDHV